MKDFQPSLEFARQLDGQDPLAMFRREYLFPQHRDRDVVYLTGNSLGLQPKRTRSYLDQELKDWAGLGVRGHLEAQTPWVTYTDSVLEPLGRVVGALPSEVAAANSLTVNLHLMMVSFYRPTEDRHKILMEAGAFPSDVFAVNTQIRAHDFDPERTVIEVRPREGEDTLREEDLMAAIDRDGDQIALVLLGNVNYRTGQAFNIKAITELAHRKGCQVGFDLAHGAGNLTLRLHDWGPDFAVWCSYKYLNSGPGGVAGFFVHERHHHSFDLPRFAGWWGQNRMERFKMTPHLDLIPGAEGWLISNVPILSTAALRASLSLFDEAGVEALATKRDQLTNYLFQLLGTLPEGFCQIITPAEVEQRGAQLSLRVKGNPQQLVQDLKDEGIYCDFRYPDVIRGACVPMYVSYQDLFRFYEVMKRHAG